MKIFHKSEELQKYALECKRSGKTIALVPTMGFLHAGHASLIDIAAKRGDEVIVSIFVNPTQFNDKGDLAAYPRTLPADLELLSPIGPDYVFAPSVE